MGHDPILSTLAHITMNKLIEVTWTSQNMYIIFQKIKLIIN